LRIYHFLNHKGEEPKNENLFSLFSNAFSKQTMESLKTLEDSVKTIDDYTSALKSFS
jgi:hypothetical protein